MSDILRPVANLPLTVPPRGVLFRMVKGCSFNKGLRLDPDKLYLLFHSREQKISMPPAGFYDVPDKGIVIFVKEFKPYARSEFNEFGWRVYVFRAFQGDPPLDWKPDKNFNYKQAEIERVVMQQEARKANVH
jgi:hypothetical protein